MPYRDEPASDELNAAVAKRRAIQLRDELAIVERLARVLVSEVSSAGSTVARKHADVASVADPFERWWLVHMTDRWLAKVPEIDQTKVAHERVALAEARAQASIASELAAIARHRAEKLREAIAAAEIAAAKAAATEPRDEQVSAAVASRGLRDAVELTVDLRSMIVAADEAASRAQRDAIRAVLEGRDAVTEASDSSFLHAMRDLARTRVQLELVRASLLAQRGPSDATVAALAEVARGLSAQGDAPDEAWRRRVARDRERVGSVIDELESQLARLSG